MSEAPESLRVDKWLWHARFFKSRTLAAKFVTSGKARLNGSQISKAHVLVRPNDVLTFPLGPHIRVIKILGLGVRRGPAPEAQALYEDLDPPQPRVKTEAPVQVAEREKGSGRPTKKERREIDRWVDTQD